MTELHIIPFWDNPILGLLFCQRHMKKTIFTDSYKLLISTLVQERKDARLTQQQLADKLGRHQSYVAKYEKRERRLDVIELIQIAKAIQIDIEPLIRKIQLSIESES